MPVDFNEMPEAYDLGWTVFCGLIFKVNPGVLIPRFETEQLVNEVTAYIKDSFKPDQKVKVLDVGTGSGCIAISLAKKLYNVEVTGVDVSDEALEVANLNAKGLEVSNVTFKKSNLLEDVEGDYDVVVANLPYIPSKRIPILDSSVKDFEPHLALDGGEDGFELYRRLFKQISQKTKPKLIYVEIDDTHGDIAKSEAEKIFTNADVQIVKDVSRFDRFLVIKF